ncbi:hypothetical protein QQF64_014223 [Cirrhinus molitorella]|uniref:Claspin n=1 Tax=Cirrhinus molitorella TaxID=172907 RepID=A0ABR3LTC8_9TELE
MSSLLSERPVDLAEARTAESDSDSGMGSPLEEPVIDNNNMATKDQQDSDEDIAVSRKGRSRKALQDSDSDGEQEESGMANALVLSESSDEETKTTETESIKKKRGKRVSRISMDSDESEPEKEEVQVKPKGAKKKREKSQRRKEKEKRNVALVKQLKEKTEEPPPIKALNDSGCLLGDSDLFDAQLEEDSEHQLEGEEEESLDAIRSAVKKKAKHKPHLSDFSGDEEQENRLPRKERKAAKASKEAIKQLHSESQRLVRESMLNLPYYMPEPKSIDQFFKRRPRPEGRGMALLKSAKYQACILESTTQPPQDQTTRSQDSGPTAESSLDNQFSTTSLPLADATTSTHQDDPTNDGNPQTSSEAQNIEHDISTDEPKPVGQEKETLSTETSEQLSEKPQVSADQVQTAPQMLKPRKDKLARLRELGLDPPPVAKLCADDGAFVQLEPPQENPALKALQERFMKHLQPATRPKRERTLQLNVVRKDSAPSGQEELRSESITITVNEGEDEPANVKPGEKLVLLKSRLQQAMAIRRKEERERRAALRRLDNEDCEEEEEAEMTESEDEEGVDELLGDGGGDDEEEEREDEEAVDKEEGEDEVSVKTCPSPGFKSPSPTPADTDGTLMLFAGNSCSRTGDGVRRLGPADNKMEEDDALSLAKDSSHNSSFELMGSMIPSYQPVNRAAGRGLSNSAFRSPSPCLFRSSFLGSASKSSGKMSEPSLSLPVEDSQDLYAPSSPSESALPPAGDSQGRFSLEEDTHSQLLDADGFLNVGPRGAPVRSHKRQLILDSLDENAMDANMGELLGLCSGGFGSGQTQPGASQPAAEDELLGLCSGAFSTQPQEPVVKPKEKSKTSEPEEQRGESQGSSEADMDQLLALCSGKFTGSPSASSLRSVSSPAFEKPSETTRNKNIIEEQEDEEEEEEEGDCEFRLLSDVDSLSEKDENEHKSDVEEEEDSENEGEEEEQEEEREAVFGRRPGKKKIRLAEFVDSEAELSGSDVGSEDEDDDGGDEYEEEEIQEDLPSDEELMDQVNKIHMKQILDDDKRKLRLYQERYLADGDLHSDGPGRARRFRWKNIDDNFEFGGTGPDGDEEEEDEEVDQLELQRRKERLEREQWMREQTEARAKKPGEDADDEEKLDEEDSQFMKLAKKFTAKTLQKRDTPAVPLQEKAAPNTNQFRKPFQPTVVKRGSLLSQPKAMLQKLASISDSNPLAPRNSRGFLFQTLSPEKEQPASEGPKKQIKKRGQMDSFSPAAKRPCLGSSLKSTGPPRTSGWEGERGGIRLASIERRRKTGRTLSPIRGRKADNDPASESQAKLKMLQQDRTSNPMLGSQPPVGPPSTLRIQKRCDKDGNFNFLGQDDDDPMTGDENRNQVRPRALGRDPPLSSNHFVPGPLSPLSRLPCWSPLEPLPEIESGDDMGGRVPPDGAEEGKLDEEMRRATDDEKEEALEQNAKDDDDDEDGEIDWADSDEDFEFSYRSGSSSPFSAESADNGAHNSLWDQICRERPTADALKNQKRPDEKAERRRESLEGADAVENASSDSDTDPCSDLPDLMEAVWTLQDRERFKAQEMEKHQVQLTMYRRLALIRWVRTLQNRVLEQQNRLQSSFDIILTHRKELLRMGAATAAQ